MIDHPLFPPADEGDEGPDVGFIHVVRHEGGQPAWCTYLFTAEELVGLDQIYALFGGGNYELVARTTSKGGFVARVRYRIEGPSKPLVMPSQVGAPTATAVAMPMAQSGGDSGLASFMPIMAQMMMGMMQQTTAIITAAMSRDSDSGKVHVQTMQLLHDRSMQSQAEMLKAVLESRNSGGAASEVVKALREGLELGREMSQGQQEEPDEDGMMSTLGHVAEAFKMAQGFEGPATSAAAEVVT
jgi:hypothetical protein